MIKASAIYPIVSTAHGHRPRSVTEIIPAERPKLAAFARMARQNATREKYGSARAEVGRSSAIAPMAPLAKMLSRAANVSTLRRGVKMTRMAEISTHASRENGCSPLPVRGFRVKTRKLAAFVPMDSSDA